MKILVSGASGFIGAPLILKLRSNASYETVAAVRNGKRGRCTGVDVMEIADLSDIEAWGAALQGVDVVIHLAGRAHVLGSSLSDPLAEYRRINVQGSVALASAALASGVKRFIFVSSIGVNGSHTPHATDVFDEQSIPAPHAAYALSKLEAERRLYELANDSPMELVIIRPPLVYAGNAPGNFQRLMKMVASGLPLPLGSVTNKRSIVALENLVDFIATCISHPAAANELFLISDGIDVSTVEILTCLAEGMERKLRLFSCPSALMQIGAALIGKRGIYTQLCGSLRIDSSKARLLLGWKPVTTPHAALRRAGISFLKQRNKQ
ncbi:NAD-dependent epimerase/dehydratase family protein [Eoetvoesiella caeni]